MSALSSSFSICLFFSMRCSEMKAVQSLLHSTVAGNCLNTSFQVSLHPQLLFKNKQNINIFKHTLFSNEEPCPAGCFNEPCLAIRRSKRHPRSATASVLQPAVAAKRGMCLGRMQEAISSTRALMSAAAHHVPLTVRSLDNWLLL